MKKIISVTKFLWTRHNETKFAIIVLWKVKN